MSTHKANKGSKASNTKATTATHAQNNDEISYDIITTDSWNINEHVCGPAKPNKSGQGKSAPFTYNKRKFFIKVPKMYCPFGASKPKPKPGDKEQENPPWSLQLSFGDDPQSQTFHKKALEFDQFMIDQAAKPDNCVSWLGAPKTKTYSREVVESKYNPMVKPKDQGEGVSQYPPYIRAQFPTTFKSPYEFTCEIYDKNNVLMDISTNPEAPNCISKIITPGTYCSALLSGSIWCNSTGYGVTWRVAQLKFFPPKGLPKGKCLVDDPEDDEYSETSDNEKNSPEDDDNMTIIDDIDINDTIDANTSENNVSSSNKNTPDLTKAKKHPNKKM